QHGRGEQPPSPTAPSVVATSRRRCMMSRRILSFLFLFVVSVFQSSAIAADSPESSTFSLPTNVASGVIGGRHGSTCARVGSAAARLFSGDWLCNGEEMLSHQAVLTRDKL